MFGLDLVPLAQQFLTQYGLLAVFVFTFLESSLLFPLIPSEAFLPIAAALLISGLSSLALFVFAATMGVIIGSLVAYYLFGRGGEELAERYGPVFRVSERELEMTKWLFNRYGQTSVFWGRFLPILRSVVSIPAGFASMDVRRFTVYSAGGGLLFNLAVGALALGGEDSKSVYAVVYETAIRILSAYPVLTVVAVILLVVVGLASVRFVGEAITDR